MAELRGRLGEVARRIAGRGADVCLVVIELSIWLAGTILAALGCLLMVAILVSDGHPTRFFLHLQNLCAHYLAADASARLRFGGQLAGFYVGIVALLSIARWPSFIARLRAGLARRSDDG